MLHFESKNLEPISTRMQTPNAPERSAPAPSRQTYAILAAFRLERRTLITIGVAAFCLWAFFRVGAQVVSGATRTFDESFILMFRQGSDALDPIGPPWMQELMRDVTGLGGVGFLSFVSLATMGFLFVSGKPRAAIAIGLAIGLGLLLSTLLKMGFDRPRPDLVPHGSLVHSASFPSGHALMTAVVTLTLASMIGQVLPKRSLRVYVMSLAIFITAVVGVSRVYLGVHWPTDVIAGWLVGALWALLCTTLMVRLQLFGLAEATPVEGED
jgi:undecaprenyl-diphosphatase